MEKERIRLDAFKRKIYLKYEIKFLLYRSILSTNSAPLANRYWVFYNKNKIIRVATKSQQVNKCVETGRARAVFKNTHYTRFKIRNESYAGNLPGFTRASW